MKAAPTILEFNPRPLLKRPAHIPQRARCAVIDAHNHLFGDAPARQLIDVMDETGVETFVNVTGNCSMPFDANGYTIRRRELSVYMDDYVSRYPGRFAAFTMAEFARWGDFRLEISGDFVEKCIAALEADVRQGACGLKLTKELGLAFRDENGALLAIDDRRLYPIWKRAGELGIPVLIHTSDPVGFFLPADGENEHFSTLLKYPGWSFAGSHFSKTDLLDQRTRIIAEHPGTTFICPHVANNPEDLDWVSALLDAHPNLFIDFSARMDELGRQPYSSRDFFLRFQDRILFGSDMPLSAAMYRSYFRFLETRDEYFDYPGYLGEPVITRWKINGLFLPDEVLQKVYRDNALRIIRGLKGGPKHERD
jgi:predicted TIM-barrel fold metal-dependent hydrolase